ncbi:MAG: Eco57I restriction-modification methylase domain-containing protein [Gammaproteobacteria bacterium]
MKNITQLGQVFTPPEIVRQMLALRKNRGAVLEPAAGDGAFLRALGGAATGVEIDPHYAAQSGARCMDFFDYPVSHKFETIIGNPPYVRYQDIPPQTRQKLNGAPFDRRTNLYLFFAEKCMRHLADGGELILITPRNFLKTTAAAQLNRMLYEGGTITDFIELGDARVFDGASPNCAIWRFEKGDFSRRTNGGALSFAHAAGQIFFRHAAGGVSLGEIFSVRVGAVSGMDSVFANARGNRDFVCSRTAKTGETRRMFYNINHPALLPHKQKLLARRIRKFGEGDWWQWGRAHCDSPRPRIYVNAKTRRAAPFFLHPARDYDGSVLALFPRGKARLRPLRDALNAADWNALGFICGGRFLFGQRSLQNCVLPESFARFAAPVAA